MAVTGGDFRPEPIDEGRKTVKLYDLRSHNIDRLRFITATYDWSQCLVSRDMQNLYDMFVHAVLFIIEQSIPVRNVRLGHRNPAFVTPLVKVLLKKRCRLRKQGRSAEADSLAARINELIHTVRSTQLAQISSRCSKELWSSVKATSNGQHRSNKFPQHIFADIEQASRYFAEVSHSPQYCSGDVYAFLRNNNNNIINYDNVDRHSSFVLKYGLLNSY